MCRLKVKNSAFSASLREKKLTRQRKTKLKLAQNISREDADEVTGCLLIIDILTLDVYYKPVKPIDKNLADSPFHNRNLFFDQLLL